MKQKFTKKLFFGTILVFLILFGCKQDDFDKDANRDNSYVSNEYWINGFYFKNTTVTELGSSPEFSGIIEKLGLKHRFGNHSGKLNGREIDLGRYDFEIEEESVKEIRMEDYDYVSYTFKIHRAESHGYFENLVVTQYEGVEQAYIFSYNPNEEWIAQYDQEMNVPFQGSFVVEQLEFEGTSHGNCIEMVMIVETPCSCEGHLPGQFCVCAEVGGEPPKYAEWTVTDCSGGGGIFNGDIGAPPGNGQVGNGPGNPENLFVITSPVGMDGKTLTGGGGDNCNTLNKLTQTDSLSANIKPIVDELRTKVTLDKEWYCHFRKQIYGGELYTFPEEGGVQEGISQTRSELITGTTWFGQIHTHPIETYAIFSWLDLRGLRNIYEDVHPDFHQDVFLMIVCHNGEVYSLKIDSFEILSDKIDDDLEAAEGAGEEEKWTSIEKELAEYYRENKDNLEGAFLQKYGSYGISLYKATDENLTNWDKLELANPNSNSLDVNPISCN